MDLYYVDSDAREPGRHEVHIIGCDYFPLNPIYLGPFSDLEEALDKARRYYPKAEGCQDCCAPSPSPSRVFFNPH